MHQPLGAEGDEAAVQLHGRDHDDQDVGPQVLLLGDAVADGAGKRPGQKHGQQLEADDGLRSEEVKVSLLVSCSVPGIAPCPRSWICPDCAGSIVRPDQAAQRINSTYQISTCPSLVRLGVDHPQLGKGVVAGGLRAVGAVRVAEEVVGGRGEGEGVLDRRQRHPGEEAVVEKAALEAEVDQGVEGVPDEEAAVAGRGRGRQHRPGPGVGDGEDRDRRRERDQRRLVEQVRRQVGEEGVHGG